jgi:hypothetical protein
MSSDGGHFWPTRAGDARTATLTGGATTPDDVKAFLIGQGYTGTLDDMWKQYKVANGITDTSEPWAGPGGGGGGGAWPDANSLSFVSFQQVFVTNLWDGIWNDDGTRLYTMNASNGTVQYNATDFATPYVIDSQAMTQSGVTNNVGGGPNRSFDWTSDGGGVIHSSITTGVHGKRLIDSSATAYNPAIGVGFGFEAADTQTFDTGAGFDSRSMQVCNGGQTILTTSNEPVSYSGRVNQINLTAADDLSTASNGTPWDPTERIYSCKFDPTGNSGYATYDDTGVVTLAKFTVSTQWDISTATLDTANSLNLDTSATGIAVQILWRPDGSGMYTIEWTSSTTGGVSLYTP